MIEFVKRLNGEYIKIDKSWQVSLHHLRRLLDRFPCATMDKAALVAARLEMWRRWMVQHNAIGVWFALDVDGETVIPVGDGVDQIFVEWVAQRSAILYQFLGEQRITKIHSFTMPIATSIDDDMLIWSGIQAALRNEKKRAAIVKRRRQIPRNRRAIV
jgi:hypothetical protein